LFYFSTPRLDLHSFPTRRSSDLGLPLVMKPIDGMRSANTYRIRSLQDVRRYFDSVRAASPRGVLLEQFVDGEELSCEVVLHKGRDRKSTRLNSSHLGISYAVFCL